MTGLDPPSTSCFTADTRAQYDAASGANVAMKLHYYPETDSLYIELSSTPGTETREVAEGLVADFNSAGNVVGLDIDHASRKLDLSKIETIALPAVHAAE
jgi:uncharacterized protein YuzE